MNYFHKFLYIFFLSLEISLVICQNVPDPRYDLASTLVGSKFFFFGGAKKTTQTPQNSFTSETWYLELSSSFSTTKPPWSKSADMPVAYYFGSSCVSPSDYTKIYLVGGRTPSNTAPSGFSVYVFNSQIPQWTTWNSNRINPINASARSSETQAVINDKGKIFIFGGISPNGATFYNDMNVFDTTSTTLSTLPQTVPKYADYAAVLLKNGSIIYIGGRQSALLTDMSQLLIYDTNSNSWSTQKAGGVSIGSRLGHSAILTSDNRIIIYGGSTGGLSNSSKLNAATPSFAVLDISTLMWYIPIISQTNAPPQPLMYHCAALYNDYMFIAFGRTTTNPSNMVYIFDTIEYLWVNQTASTDPILPISYKQPTDKLNVGLGIGFVAIVLVGISFCVGIWIYNRRHKISTKSSKSKAPTFVTPSTPTTEKHSSGLFTPRALVPATPTSDVFLQPSPNTTPSSDETTPNTSDLIIPRSHTPRSKPLPILPTTSGSFMPKNSRTATPISETSSSRSNLPSSLVPATNTPSSETPDSIMPSSSTSNDYFHN